MKKKFSGIIINDNSEFNSFNFLISKRPDIFKHPLIVFDRRLNTDLKNFHRTKSLNILTCKTSHDWFNFVSTAKKFAEEIFNIFDLQEIYFFSKYDPLLVFLSNFFSDLKFISIYQNPLLELNTFRNDFSAKLKGSIKRIFLSFFIKDKFTIKYLDGQHSVEISNKNIRVIRMYPSTNKNIFNFGQIHKKIDSRKNIVLINQPLYTLKSINYKSFLKDTVNLIEKYEIRNICFHPRDIDQFKNDIRNEFPDLTYHNFYSRKNYANDHLIASIMSTACFNNLILGESAAFIPDEYPSTHSEKSVKIFMKYLYSL